MAGSTPDTLRQLMGIHDYIWKPNVAEAPASMGGYGMCICACDNCSSQIQGRDIYQGLYHENCVQTDTVE